LSKSYKAARAEQKGKPIVFDIEGEEFSVPRLLNGFILLDFADLSGSEGGAAVKAYAEFFRDIFANKNDPDDSEYKRFRKVCSKYRVPLKAAMDATEMGEDELSLLSIAQYIIEESTGRPTEQRSDSSQQLSATGTSSDTAA
jgi:hypothetical protein